MAEVGNDDLYHKVHNVHSGRLLKDNETCNLLHNQDSHEPDNQQSIYQHAHSGHVHNGRVHNDHIYYDDHRLFVCHICLGDLFDLCQNRNKIKKNKQNIKKNENTPYDLTLSLPRYLPGVGSLGAPRRDFSTR